MSPMFFGYTILHSGSWTPAFSISIALLLVGALLALRLRPDKPFMAPPSA